MNPSKFTQLKAPLTGVMSRIKERSITYDESHRVSRILAIMDQIAYRMNHGQSPRGSSTGIIDKGRVPGTRRYSAYCPLRERESCAQ